MATISIEIRGLQEVSAKVTPPKNLYGAAADSYQRKSAQTIVDKARPHIPRDTGVSADSLHVRKYGDMEYGIVSSSRRLRYVIGQPGRGTSERRSRPHFPPLSALRPWARRHGIPVFLVAKAIAAQGTPIVPAIDRGIQDYESRRRGILGELISAIESKWRS